MTDTQLREQISAILVKWHMPTRQAAISEIMEVVATQQRLAVEEAEDRGLSYAANLFTLFMRDDRAYYKYVLRKLDGKHYRKSHKNVKVKPHESV